MTRKKPRPCNWIPIAVLVLAAGHASAGSTIPGLKADENLSDLARLEGFGAKVVQRDGIVTHVEFTNCAKLGIAEFQFIGRMTQMKSLTLHGQCNGLTDKTLPYLLELKNLETLSTDRIQVTDHGLAAFTEFQKIRSMSFFHISYGTKGFDGRGFSSLKAMPELRQLTIAGSPFNDCGMEAVAEIKQLRNFRTWHTYQTQAGNEWLTKLPELRTLLLGQRLRRYDGGSNAVSLDDATFDVFTRLKTLESLTLSEAQLSLTALRRLSELPHLKHLELRDVDVPETNFDALMEALPAVKVVWKPMTNEARAKLNAFLSER